MKNKVILYGHFGSGNIGNDSTLEATLYNLKYFRPNVNVICVCNGPQKVARRFGIETLSMGGAHIDESSSHMGSRFRRLLFRLMDEVQFWLKRPVWFQPGDLFIVVGTGAVDDMAVQHPWHSPYELYKWCKTAKLGKARVIFLSVGVGPIVNRVSKTLMLGALQMADYRSYREPAAFEYLHGLGYDTTGDYLYPDLVYSLPKQLLPLSRKISTPVKVVGLGLINYYGWRHQPGAGDAIYREYITKIKKFAAWLFRNGYTVRIISGDAADVWTVQEFIEYVHNEGDADWIDHLIVENIADVAGLFAQVAQTDIVVASRFHNVLCSLMLERPVISLGYHEKNSNLMTEMGLADFCQHIEDFTFEKLVEQFECYAADIDQAVHRIHDKNEQYRLLLEEQYRNIFLPADSNSTSLQEHVKQHESKSN